MLIKLLTKKEIPSMESRGSLRKVIELITLYHSKCPDLRYLFLYFMEFSKKKNK